MQQQHVARAPLAQKGYGFSAENRTENLTPKIPRAGPVRAHAPGFAEGASRVQRPEEAIRRECTPLMLRIDVIHTGYVSSTKYGRAPAFECSHHQLDASWPAKSRVLACEVPKLLSSQKDE